MRQNKRCNIKEIASAKNKPQVKFNKTKLEFIKPHYIFGFAIKNFSFIVLISTMYFQKSCYLAFILAIMLNEMVNTFIKIFKNCDNWFAGQHLWSQFQKT